jgi:alpha-methylacyl-CoA racemase
VTGPLAGVRVVEMAAIGPGPFTCMLLADLGAEVVSVHRVGARQALRDAHQRGRRSICVDVKRARGAALVLDLIATADVLVEGFRPGVMERLGLGPAECHARNPRLVYGRMTGWGQEGPLASSAGHDLSYLAITGALHATGPSGGPPVPPLNLVADYGGGGMLLAFGIAAALFESRASGLGQVVDAAMIDGVAAMLAPFYAMTASGMWRQERGQNLLDGGAHFYGTYLTQDSRWVSVAALEPQFYRALMDLLGLDSDTLGPQMDQSGWPAARAKLAAVFLTRTRDEWVACFAGTDACVQPVLDLAEATRDPHAAAREMFADRDGIPHPRPAPRFSRTAAALPPAPEDPGASTDAILTSAGLRADEIDCLRRDGVIA